MAAMFPAIYDAIDRNPHKDLEVKIRNPEQNPIDTRWDYFTATPLDPPGAVSCILYYTDILYGQATKFLRKQMLREYVLELQERCDKELKGRRWPRKKIHDLLGQQCAIHIPQRDAILDEGLSELVGCQLLLLDRQQKQITFVPSDPRLWRADKPIYVADIDYRWIFEPTTEISLLTWLTQKEDESWKIHWPTADGKLEDMKSAVSERNLTAHKATGTDINGKIKKEDWARVLGRIESLEALQGIQLSTL
jgi:hypothetical protein